MRCLLELGIMRMFACPGWWIDLMPLSLHTKGTGRVVATRVQQRSPKGVYSEVGRLISLGLAPQASVCVGIAASSQTRQSYLR